jgi:hypothetical protein
LALLTDCQACGSLAVRLRKERPLRTVTPRLATTISARVPEAAISRSIQPSRPNPFTQTIFAAAIVLASPGVGA